MSNAEPVQQDGQTWFGHPPQLARLFTTEMWERFGYYGMRALLTLYLTNYFFFKDEVSSGLYGAFTALVYLTPLFGGLLADRYLGYKNSVKLGAVMMAIGYFCLCFGSDRATPILKFNNQVYDVTMDSKLSADGAASGGNGTVRFVQIDGKQFQVKADKENGGLILLATDGATPSIEVKKGTYSFDGKRNPFWVNVMFMSLACIVIGNGFFKPNISTIVGTLYQPGDSRRDAGFTIFYMGINLGSLLSQLACPFLFEAVGPWAGFLLAAIGMFVAWVLFQFDGGRLKGFGEIPASSTASARWMIYVGAFLFVPVAWWLMNNTMNTAQAAADAAAKNQLASASAVDTTNATASGGPSDSETQTSMVTAVIQYFNEQPVLGKFLFVVILFSTIGIPAWAYMAGTRAEAEKMLVATVLIVFSVVFWTLFEQAGSSLTLFAERNTDLQIGSYKMPAGQTQSFNALFIVIFAPIFSMFWAWLGSKKLEPSIPVKFAIGLILVGVGFLTLVFGKNFAGDDALVPLFWLALMYLIHSIGELCISPVGLSMITKLSMPKVVGLMMGVWFLSSATAQYVGGIIAQFAAVETVGGEVTNPVESLNTYVDVFQTIGLVGTGIGVGLLLISPFLKRLMHGVN